MNIFRRPRPGRRHVDALLDGTAAPSSLDDLAGLLEAARRVPGPRATPGELPGERTAVAAFRTAAASRTGRAAQPSTPEETPSVRPATSRRLLTVLVAGALTTTVGGVAFAATSGMSALTGSDKGSTISAEHRPTSTPTGSPSSARSADASRSGEASGKPTAVRPGLDERAALLLDCRLWTTVHATASAGEHTDEGPGFADLIAAAGGAEKAPAYCAALVEELCPDTQPGARGESPDTVPGAVPGCPRVEPTKPAKPTQAATGKPSTRPTDKPSSAPTTTRTRPEPSGSAPQSPRPEPSKKPTSDS